jgi:sec-independent protein translocase protein TatB
MFDVSFGELLLILVVGLLVFGPEKLPQVVRTTSQWINHLRRSFNQIRADIEREVGVDELKRDLHNQSILDSLRDVKKDLQGAQDELDRLPYEVNESVRENFRREAQTATPSGAPAPAPEHVIPDDDFAHRERQAINTPAIDAPVADTTPDTAPDNAAATRPQNS